MAADAWRPLIRKENELVVPKVFKKVESFLKNGHYLDRQKMEEFIARERGVMQTPTPPRRFVCQNCKMTKLKEEIVEKNDRFYCLSCAKEITVFTKPTIKEKAKEYKPHLTYAERKSLMSLPESRMDVGGLEKLQARGHKVEYQPTVILVWTKPEYLVDDKAYFYNDGEAVHKNTKPKDEWLRTKLAEVTGKQVFGIPYDVYNVKNLNEVVEFIESKVGKPERVMEAIEK